MLRRDTWVDRSRSGDRDEDGDGSRKDGSDGRFERMSLLGVGSSGRSRGSVRVFGSGGRRSWGISSDQSVVRRRVGVTLWASETKLEVSRARSKGEGGSNSLSATSEPLGPLEAELESCFHGELVHSVGRRGKGEKVSHEQRGEKRNEVGRDET